jgi:hypothetical protein
MFDLLESSNRIEAQRITKPIQLLAAWLVGLVLVNASFFTAAAALSEPWWLRVVLVVAAVLNVPIFLIAIFLLQTRFRPEMQEDTFYSRYLESQLTNKPQMPGEELSSIRRELFEATSRTLQNVEGLQNQVSILAAALDSRRTRDTEQSALAQLSLQIVESKRLLDQARSDITWTKYNIWLNDLIPAYETINGKLQEKGITLSGTFGSSSQVPWKPELVRLSFGSDIDVQNIQQLISILDGHIEAINYSDQSIHQRRIYIGGYGYQREPSARLTSQFVEKLSKPGLTVGELIRLVTNASRPPIPNLRAIVDSFPTQQRTALRLFLGLETGQPASLEEISAALKTSLDNARSLLQSVLGEIDQHISH